MMVARKVPLNLFGCGTSLTDAWPPGLHSLMTAIRDRRHDDRQASSIPATQLHPATTAVVCRKGADCKNNPYVWLGNCVQQLGTKMRVRLSHWTNWPLITRSTRWDDAPGYLLESVRQRLAATRGRRLWRTGDGPAPLIPAQCPTVSRWVSPPLPSDRLDVKANAGGPCSGLGCRDQGAMVRAVRRWSARHRRHSRPTQLVNALIQAVSGTEQFGSGMAMRKLEFRRAIRVRTMINVAADTCDRSAKRSATVRCAGQQHYQRHGRAEPGFRRGHVRHFDAAPQGFGGCRQPFHCEQIYVIPAAGNGVEAFTSNILAMGDTLNLTTALAATNWNGSASTLSNYLKVTDSAHAATLSISAISGGSGVVIATIDGATTATLSSLLAHSIT